MFYYVVLGIVPRYSEYIDVIVDGIQDEKWKAIKSLQGNENQNYIPIPLASNIFLLIK